MLITGQVMIRNKIIKHEELDFQDNSLPFHEQLEKAFLILCKKLGISAPIWLNRNTRELALCRKTNFDPDQFMESFEYDKFVLRIDK